MQCVTSQQDVTHCKEIPSAYSIVVAPRHPSSLDHIVLYIFLTDKVLSIEAVASSVVEGWGMLEAETIAKVFGKLPDIWEQIIESQGMWVE